MNTPLQQAPYLREQRQFPNTELKALSNQVDHAYIDIASKVNARIIGTYAVNFPIITGESWFLSGEPKRQQTLRQVYTFTSVSTPIPTGFKLANISQVVQMYGTYSDGTNTYGLIAGTSAAIAGQISFYIALNGSSSSSDNITFLSGAGSPSLTTGIIVIARE